MYESITICIVFSVMYYEGDMCKLLINVYVIRHH